VAVCHRSALDHRCEFVDLENAALENYRLMTSPADAVFRACEARELLRVYVDYIRRTLRLEEQVAVLLADVHGYRDKDSASLVGMSLASFKLLLHRARSRLQWITADTQTQSQDIRAHLVGAERACATDPRSSGPSISRASTPMGNLVRSSRRVGVARRVSREKLLALRDELLNLVSGI
jgi:hypothetical protein